MEHWIYYRLQEIDKYECALAVRVYYKHGLIVSYYLGYRMTEYEN